MVCHHDAAPFGRRRASASGSRGRLHPGLCFQGDLSSEDNRLEIGESAVLARIVRTRGGVRLDFPGGEARAKARLAAGARTVEYHVKQNAVADKVREMAKPFSNVTVIWNPRGEHAC